MSESGGFRGPAPLALLLRSNVIKADAARGLFCQVFCLGEIDDDAELDNATTYSA